MRGNLVVWKIDKGFGFIESEGNQVKRTFIHISSLKHMSREPKVGDFIHFDIEKQNDGKSRAVNCRIEGVAAKKVDFSRKMKSGRKPSSLLSVLISIVLLTVILTSLYDRFSAQSTVVEKDSYFQKPNLVEPFEAKREPSRFKCDGRQYCSQMNSRAEAVVFFIRNCPNTKMDGDRDGNPCENDSRF
ncbi:cold shock domain-containing protein [Pseudoalteromonas sp. G4]|uniref:cold shock domain-containing protein n=1 Tax=Pseudoalteromonas sp. G4 TaxID=2992761 RepID=UPI00237E92A2|nr:cold shock domain-containing protein [Pseudoalteromonas sp. G4]MDE3270819.1 excalibur calcium-binding domain-containing protein [Pseudoalteromonas sp. G4]